jgi:cytidylate kinase
MAQVTIYLPDRVATAARRQAGRAGKSVSAWIAEVLERETGARRWPRALVDILTHGNADLVEPDDPPPEDMDSLR